MNAQAAIVAVALAIGCGPNISSPDTAGKGGLANVSVAASGNTWSLPQRQAVLNDQNPPWWHNFNHTREGEVAPPGGGVYVPFLIVKSDLRNHSKVATAVSEAAASRWVLTLGEFDAREFTTDADAAAAWCELMADSAVVAHPEIRFVGGYTVEDGSIGGSHTKNWLAAVAATPACPLPKALALDKYGAAGTAPATNTATIMSRVNNYIAAFPGYEIWVPEMGVLGGATTWNGTLGLSLTFADNGATGDTITRTVGSWATDGFVGGDTIKITGAVASSGANNVTGAMTAVSATVITFGATPLVNEGPITTARVGVTAGQVVTDTSTTMTSLVSQLNQQGKVTHFSWWFTGNAACCSGPYNSATQYLYDDTATISPIGTTWKSLLH